MLLVSEKLKKGRNKRVKVKKSAKIGIPRNSIFSIK
jgi:hypothetical protein